MSVLKQPGQTTVVIQYYSLSWFFETDVRSKICMFTYHSDYSKVLINRGVQNSLYHKSSSNSTDFD